MQFYNILVSLVSRYGTFLLDLAIIYKHLPRAVKLLLIKIAS